MPTEAAPGGDSYSGGVSNPASAGRTLAARHRRRAEPDPTASVLNYAESARTDDWTLRSALVRLAQPEPTRSGAVLELVRRCDAALHPMISTFEAQTVLCDRGLTINRLDAETLSPETGADAETATDDEGRYPDARVVDLARLALDAPDRIDAIIEAYGEEAELAEVEQLALPLLGVALRLDALGQLLADWAAGPQGRQAPVSEVDEICSEVFSRLEEIGVPREQGPPRGRRRG